MDAVMACAGIAADVELALLLLELSKPLELFGHSFRKKHLERLRGKFMRSLQDLSFTEPLPLAPPSSQVLTASCLACVLARVRVSVCLHTRACARERSPGPRHRRLGLENAELHIQCNRATLGVPNIRSFIKLAPHTPPVPEFQKSRFFDTPSSRIPGFQKSSPSSRIPESGTLELGV